jgi:hypothetical protein
MHRPLLVVLALLLVSPLLGCSGGNAPDAAGGGGAEASPPASALEEAPPIGSGESADLKAFLEDYEKFVEKYCELAERFPKATLAEMVQLGEEMAALGLGFTEYSTRAIAMRASASPDAQEKMDALSRRADACGEKIGG